jgi:formylglycine-generating enzyme required for sulfatase activity
VASDAEGSKACYRVVRGGSWFTYAEQDLRAGARGSAHPGGLNDTIGLRLAR